MSNNICGDCRGECNGGKDCYCEGNNIDDNGGGGNDNDPVSLAAAVVNDGKDEGEEDSNGSNGIRDGGDSGEVDGSDSSCDGYLSAVVAKATKGRRQLDVMRVNGNVDDAASEGRAMAMAVALETTVVRVGAATTAEAKAMGLKLFVVTVLKAFADDSICNIVTKSTKITTLSFINTTTLMTTNTKNNIINNIEGEGQGDSAVCRGETHSSGRIGCTANAQQEETGEIGGDGGGVEWSLIVVRCHAIADLGGRIMASAMHTAQGSIGFAANAQQGEAGEVKVRWSFAVWQMQTLVVAIGTTEGQSDAVAECHPWHTR
jgi:hypothetical protein